MNFRYLHICSPDCSVMIQRSIFSMLLFAGLFWFLSPEVSSAQQIQVQSEAVQVPEKRFSGVEISGPTEICEGSETALKVDGEYESYNWSTGEVGRTIKVSKPGVYEVTVKTKGGCSLTTSVNVRIRPCT